MISQNFKLFKAFCLRWTGMCYFLQYEQKTVYIFQYVAFLKHEFPNFLNWANNL